LSRPQPASCPASPGLALLPAAVATGALPGSFFLAAAGCLLLAFLFSLFETALQHYSRVRLMAEAKRKGTEEAIDRLLEHGDEIYFASKVGRGLLHVLSVACLVLAFAGYSPSAASAIGWTAALAVWFLLVNVAIPYVLGSRYADAILLRWLVPYARILRPVRPPTNLLHRMAARLVRASARPDPSEEIKDEILSAVEEGTREGSLEASEKRMIEGVIDLRDVTVDRVMTPRTEMVCIDVETGPEEAIARSLEDGLSRLPVFRGTPDDIVGILYVKDFLAHVGKGRLPAVSEILRAPFFVPQSKNVGELLHEMRAQPTHMAVVLDEYGGTAGLVTIEDILEEIVGEIVDEHEAAPPREVVEISEGAASVDGRTHIDELNRALDLAVPESEEYETVGGLLFSRLGRVPNRGESVDLDGVRFTVEDADERRVNRVKVSRNS
jgi:CBS domain containing-hemolysin-like protein